jgi:hypothetical protein
VITLFRELAQEMRLQVSTEKANRMLVSGWDKISGIEDR